MGYPPSSRGYRLRSLTMNHFFDSVNVIFDENIPYHALHGVSSTPLNYSPLPFPADVFDTIVPDPNLPSSSDVAQPLPPSHDDDEVPPSTPNNDGPTSQAVETPSSRPVLRADRKLTGGGQSYAESIQAAKVHLEKLRANRERWRQMKEAGKERAEMVTEGLDAAEGEVDKANEHFANLCREGLLEDPPDSFKASDNFAAATASLDVHGYLQCDADAFFESTFLSLRSDIACNPCSPGYNMKMPPANHHEALMRSDAEEWKKVEEKELEMLKSMGVYVDEELPEGRKAIGNRWVFESKVTFPPGNKLSKCEPCIIGKHACSPHQMSMVDHQPTRLV